MPDPITARVEPQAPSKEAMAIAQAATTMSNHPACHKYIATAIDAHTAAKDAEIATLREQLRLALESRAEYVWLWKCGGDVPTDATKAADAALRASGVKLEDTP